MPDRIEIRGIRALGHHGANPGEQDRAQPFEVDLDLDVDLVVAGDSDDLTDTLDYGTAARRTVAVIEQGRYFLLEALAQAIAAEVLALGSVRAVEVALRKLRPPVSVQLDTVGVRIVRRGEAERA